jgi:glucose/arabinose dehydrogenase
MRRLAATLLVLCSTPAIAQVPDAPTFIAARGRLQVFLRGLDMPVGLVAAPRDPVKNRLFVVEKSGRIRTVVGRTLDPTPVLDVSSRISTWTEQGLLGLAFHPKFAENGRFYVNFTDKKGDTRVVEFKLMGGRADPSSERELLHVEQPYRNHNGGNLAFGPDGKLWIGLGDGGSHDDPHDNGQNPKTFLGKMVVIDVDAPKPVPKIQELGLRNPWRYSFDRKTGDLYIADVGQDQFEEVDVLSRDDALKGGQNFGWAILEAQHCHRPPSGCPRSGLTPPVVEYTHREGCSITGGIVYRGKLFPEFDGVYFYADYCTALVRGFKWVDGKVTDHLSYKAAFDPDSVLANVAAFGEDGDGELYIVSLEGTIWKLVRR